MTIESGSNSPGILFEKVTIGSYGSSIGILLEEDELLEALLTELELDELLKLLELDELELDEELLEELDAELEELDEETLLDEFMLELLAELELLDEVVDTLLLELVPLCSSLALDVCSLEVLLSSRLEEGATLVDS